MLQFLLILAVQGAGIAGWIDRLSHDDIEVREGATRELRRVGDRADPK